MDKQRSMQELFKKVSWELKDELQKDISLRDIDYINALGTLVVIFWDRIKDDDIEGGERES